MALNPNIALQAQGIQYDPSVGLQTENALMTNELNRLKYNSTRQQMETQQRMNALIQAHPEALMGPNGPDFGALSQFAAQAGDLQGMMGYSQAGSEARQAQAGIQKTEAEARKLRAEQALVELDESQRLLSVADAQPEAWPVIRERLLGMADNEQELDRLSQMFPERFHPGMGKQLAASLMPFKEQARAELDRDKFAETQRHNLEQEATDDQKLAIERAKARAEKESRGATEEKAKRKLAREINKEFRGDQGVKAFRELSRATQTLLSALDKAPVSAPATLAAATAFMKLLDPGSVVRESELGMALGSTGLIDQIQQLAKRTDRGRVMSVDQAEEFRNLARDIYLAAEEDHRRTEDYYAQSAEDEGIDREKVIESYYVPGDMLGAQEAAGDEVATTPVPPAAGAPRGGASRKSRRDLRDVIKAADDIVGLK